MVSVPHMVFMLSVCAFSVIDGASLRIDDRLRVAKERREEADKQQGKRALPLWLGDYFKSITPIAVSNVKREKKTKTLFVLELSKFVIIHSHNK